MHTLEFKTQLIDLIDNTRQLIDKKTSLVFNVITQLKEDNENLIFKFLNFCENNNIYFEKSSSTTSLSNCNLKSRNDKQNDSHLRSVNNNISSGKKINLLQHNGFQNTKAMKDYQILRRNELNYTQKYIYSSKYSNKHSNKTSKKNSLEKKKEQHQGNSSGSMRHLCSSFDMKCSSHSNGNGSWLTSYLNTSARNTQKVSERNSLEPQRKNQSAHNTINGGSVPCSLGKKVSQDKEGRILIINNNQSNTVPNSRLNSGTNVPSFKNNSFHSYCNTANNEKVYSKTEERFMKRKFSHNNHGYIDDEYEEYKLESPKIQKNSYTIPSEDDKEDTIHNESQNENVPQNNNNIIIINNKNKKHSNSRSRLDKSDNIFNSANKQFTIRETNEEIILTEKEKAFSSLIVSKMLPIQSQIMISRSSESLRALYPIKSILKQYRDFLTEKNAQLESQLTSLNSSDQQIMFTISQEANNNLNELTPSLETSFKELTVTNENEKAISLFSKLIMYIDNEQELKTKKRKNFIISIYDHILTKHKCNYLKDYFLNIKIPLLKDQNSFYMKNCITEINNELSENKDIFLYEVMSNTNIVMGKLFYIIKDIIEWFNEIVIIGRNIGKIEFQMNKIYIVLDQLNEMNLDE